MSGKQKEMKWESSREMPSSANKPSPLRAEELTKNRSRISPHTLISKTVGRGRLARVINTTCTTGAGRWKRSTKPAAHFHHKTRSKLLIYKLNSQSTLSQWTKTRRYFSWATTPKSILLCLSLLPAFLLFFFPLLWLKLRHYQFRYKILEMAKTQNAYFLLNIMTPLSKLGSP